MIEQLVNGLGAVWSGSAIFAAVIGGLAIGYAVGTVRRRREPVARWADLTLQLGTLSCLTFWAGQIADSLLQGDPNWGRAVARCALNELFVICAAGAAWVLWRRDRARAARGESYS